MNPQAVKLTSKIDKKVSEIVSHMALPTADPKIKNQLARYVKGQIISLLCDLDARDFEGLDSVVINHLNNAPKG